MSLEDIVEDVETGAEIVHPLSKRVMVTSDYHIKYLDYNAYNVMKQYGKKYDPHLIIINGDLVDFYSISNFKPKHPRRKDQLKDEIKIAKYILKDLRKTFPDAKIVYNEGNHENRLRRHVWKHEESFFLDILSIENLLELDNINVEFNGVDIDYWQKEDGIYDIGDTKIFHGHNKQKGAYYSKWGGYAAKNTLLSFDKNIIMAHTHRLAKVNIKDKVGIESGCLCIKNSNQNWQQGFVTFQRYRGGKCRNFKLHHIRDGTLICEYGRIKSNIDK